MIVVTFALPAESSAFIGSLKNVTRDGTVVRGELKHRTSLRARFLPVGLPGRRVGSTKPEANIELRTSNFCVLHTGVGAKKCENRLREFLPREKPQLLIASGLCGGTNADLHPGDLVIAENASNSELSNKARVILPGAIAGKLHSADRIIDAAADRYQIGREHGAIAIDMETETIARLCMEKSIPLLALRIISDSPAAPFPVPPSVLFDIEKQRMNFFVLFSYIARNPSAAISLARFARQVTHAKAKLANALCAVIRAL
jgi:Phosphorylase superfamily